MTRTKTLTILAVLGLVAVFTCGNSRAAYAACSSPAGVALDILYNVDGKVFQYCDDTNWIRMNQIPGSGSGGCTIPAVPEGQIIHNVDDRLLQGCAGNVWTAMGPIGGKLGWKQVAAGSGHSCGIKSDDTAWCWGAGGSGQLGNGSTTGQSTPVEVSGGATWKAISAGGGHSCGIKSDGTAWCWGASFNGQRGDGSLSGTQTTPSAVSGGGTWKTVSTSEVHSCGIKSDDTAWCWGGGWLGQLGDGGTANPQATPVAVSGGATWKTVSVGGSGTWHHSCGIKSDDTAWCWGSNVGGQLGDNSTTASLVPTPVFGGATWKAISVGSVLSCGIKSDNTAWCWGGGFNGQLGDGSTTGTQTTPVAVSGGASWKTISVGGSSYSCGIKSDDTAWCWGSGLKGQRGDGSTTGTQTTPVAVSGSATWTAISSASGGGSHTCAVKSNNTIQCWGTNSSGQLGENKTPQRLFPDTVTGGGLWKFVAAGQSHTCAVKSDDSLWCWGLNAFGQLGDNTSATLRITQTAVSGGGAWKQVTAGTSHSCAIKSDDTLWCWGLNGNGQLGDNTVTPRLIPTAINGGGTWKQVATGNIHTCAIKSDDTLHCWGRNSNGRTGLNTSSGSALAPTQINGGGSWKKVAAGNSQTCAIKSDDTAWCWGNNGNGQLGDNSTTQRLVPTAMNGGATWKAISTAVGYSCGIQMDNTLWCWGWNNNGQLGDNSTTQRLVATAVSGGGTWTAVSAFDSHSCAIKSDGTLWCWGINASGQLGDNTTTQRLVPTVVVVYGGGAWKQVAAGATHSCAIHSDDTLLCWGSNFNGQLADLDISPYETAGVQTWCGGPVGKAGALIYNSTSNVMQYCDGVGWVGIGK